MKKRNNIGILLIILGLILGITATALSGGSIFSLAKGEEIIKKQDIKASAKDIDFNFENGEIKIALSKDSDIHLKYKETENTSYKITEGDKITIEQVNKRSFFNLVDILDLLSWKDSEFIIELPEGFANNVLVNASNIKLDAEGVSVKDLTTKIANGSINLFSVKGVNFDIKVSNALIELNNVQSEGNLNLKGSNGKISIKDSTVKGDVESKQSNGNFEFSNMNVGKDMDVSISNGSINGNLLNSIEEFTIVSSVDLGSNNLPQSTHSGTKILKANVSNGKINITFK